MSTEFDHSKATIVFVLGLIGVVGCQLTAPIAVVMGRGYRRECADAGVEPEGLGTAGFVLGIIGSGILLLTLAIFALYFVLVLGLIAMETM